MYGIVPQQTKLCDITYFIRRIVKIMSNLINQAKLNEKFIWRLFTYNKTTLTTKNLDIDYPVRHKFKYSKYFLYTWYAY